MDRVKAKNLILKLNRKNLRDLDKTRWAKKIVKIVRNQVYSEKTHFILELIQNADDCASKTLEFVLSKDKLKVINDGEAFTETDVKDLSDFGETHKGPGHIGFFGIGFKSVFLISSKPEIYSNNFSFNYDDDKLIIPYWIENIPNDLEEKLDSFEGKGTIFILPIKNKKENYPLIKRELEKISASMLLYLNNLRKFIFNGKILELKKINSNLFEVRDRKYEPTFWKSYQITLPIPRDIKSFLREDRGIKDIEKRVKEKEKIILSFEVTKNLKIRTDQIGKLYAFLSTDIKTKFNFNIQADFSVNLERTNLRASGEKWNNWVLSNVYKCIQFIIKDYKSKKINRTEFYKILPLDDPERPELLKMVEKKIDNYIRNTKTILVKSRKSKNHPYGKKWVTPKYAVIADPNLQKLFNSMDIKHFFGRKKFYVADDEIDYDGMKYIYKIVDDNFSFYEIIKFLKDSQWIFDRKIKNRKNPQKWVGDLIIYLADELDKRPYSYKYKEKLSDIKFVLTENGNLDKPKKIFIPSFKNIEIPPHLRKKYCVVNSKLIRYLEGRMIKDKKEKERRERGLDLIHEILLELSPRTIVVEIVNPAFSNDNWKKYSDSTLIKYTDFVRKNKDCWVYANIKLKVQSDGKERIYKKPYELYLSSKYGNDFGLDALYKDYENDKFISLEYIKKSIKTKSDIAKQKIKSWKKFLINRGIKEKPEIFKYEGAGIYKENIEKELAYPKDKIMDTWWTSRYPGYEIRDYDFEDDLKRILSDCINDKVKNSCKRLKVLINILDVKWDYFSQYLESQYGWHRPNQMGRTYSRLRLSSFAKFLIDSNWIPTKDGKHLKPEAVAISELKGIVKVPIIDYKITNNKFKQYLEKLGLQTKPTIEGTIAHLKARVEQNERKTKIFKKIYKYLAKHSTEKQKVKDIKERLKDIPCIYIPRSKNKYWRISDVFWRKGEVFLEWKRSIEKVYPDLKEFFIKVLGVKEKPDHWDYVEFLKSYLWEKDDLSSKEKSSLKDVYHHLNYIVTTPELKESEQWVKIKEDFKVFCEGGYWKTIRDEEIYYNDDDETYRLFRNEDINFAYIPKNKSSHEVGGLFEELGIKSLSDNFREKCSTFGKQLPASEEYEEQIRRTSKYITHFVKYKAPKKFRELNKKGAFKRLSNVSIKTVEILSVEACIGEYIVSLEKRQSFYSWETPENCVYINKSIEKEPESCIIRYIGIAIANAFAKEIGLELFIPYIFGIDDVNIVKVMQDYRIPIKEKIKIEEKEEVKKESELEKEEKEFVHIDKLSTELKRTTTEFGEKLYIDHKDFISYTIEESTPFIKDVLNRSIKKVILKKGHKEFDVRKQKLRRRVDRDDAEAIALEIVMRFEESEDREPEDRHKQPGIGYDVYSSTKNKKERFIEVKHFSREATTFELTSHQCKKAEQEKDKYFIYIVSGLREGNIPNIWIIQNPVKYLTPDPAVKKKFSNWKNKIVKKITFHKI